MNREKLLITIGSVALLLVIFGVPAVLVPFVMDDVPNRSMTKVIAQRSKVLSTVEDTFARHRSKAPHGRLLPLPENSTDWIALVNPMNSKAPGGGAAVLPQADPDTGAIGLSGDARSVTITVPAYRGLQESTVTINAKGSQ